MKIGFVYGAYESLAIEYFSAILKSKGYRVKLFYHPFLFADALFENRFLASFFNDKNVIVNKILKWEPDILAFSSLTDTFLFDSSVAKDVKKELPHIKILFGGIHATALPDLLIKKDYIDFIIVGEGEKGFLELIEVLEKNNDLSGVSNLYYKQKNIVKNNKLAPLIKDLDSLPYPDKEIFFNEAPYFKDAYTIITSRGCVFYCSFCNNNLYRRLYGFQYNGVRRRSVENVINELKIGLKKFNYKMVVFEDDMFISDIKWSYEFLEKYKIHIKKPYQCIVHPAFLNERIVKLLKESGCKLIEIGIQSLEKKICKLYNRPQNNKKIIENILLLKKYKIPFNIDHIGGAPEESKKLQLEALKLYNILRPNRITYFFLTYYPGTSITEYALKNKIIDNDEYNNLCEGMGKSYEQSGSVSDHEYEQFRVLSGLISILPKKIIDFIINKKLYRYFDKNYFLAKYIPSFITILFQREIRGVIIMKKYLYELFRFYKWI